MPVCFFFGTQIVFGMNKMKWNIHGGMDMENMSLFNVFKWEKCAWKFVDVSILLHFLRISDLGLTDYGLLILRDADVKWLFHTKQNLQRSIYFSPLP